MQHCATPAPHPDDAFAEFPWSADAEPVEAAPGLLLPSRLRARFPWVDLPDGTDGQAPTKYAGTFELIDYRFIMRQLTVEDSSDDGVTSQMLRGFTMRDMMEFPLRSSPRIRGDDGMLHLYEMHNLRHDATEGPTDANLKAAARVYAVGYAMQIRPTAAVEDALGLKRSTAENWVRRAKDKGYVFAEA